MEINKNVTDKLDKLQRFLYTNSYNSLPVLEKWMLQAQYGVMLSYNNILASRVRIAEERIYKSAKSE